MTNLRLVASADRSNWVRVEFMHCLNKAGRKLAVLLLFLDVSENVH